MRNRDSALDTLAREELAIDSEELGGLAWEAAAFSFVLFAIGAIIPVLPFLLIARPQRLGLGATAGGAGPAGRSDHLWRRTSVRCGAELVPCGVNAPRVFHGL
jgi:hypothetical protein